MGAAIANTPHLRDRVVELLQDLIVRFNNSNCLKLLTCFIHQIFLEVYSQNVRHTPLNEGASQKTPSVFNEQYLTKRVDICLVKNKPK